MNKPELLCPAGTLEKLHIAFEFGADAVYAGAPDFSLRARINEFDYNKMRQGVECAHKRGKKVYATLNIYPRNSHFRKIEIAIKIYADMGVDAIIVSDPGVLAMIKNVAPKMEIHLSTQANCANWPAAKFWQEQGVKRIVLAREITLTEICEIHKKLPKLELEYFVHGAMCMSYSGRCILSKWLSRRSADFGECSQPCRWEYDVMYGRNEALPRSCDMKISATVKEIDGVEMDIEQNKNGTYILNSKDLCLIEHLDKLWKAGVSSFKIEGRTKSAYYVGAVSKLYREGIERIFKTPQPPFKKGGIKEVAGFKYKPPNGWQDEIKKITNRGYTTGFLFGEAHCEHNFAHSHEECAWQFVGEVKESQKSIKSIKSKVKSVEWKEEFKKRIYIKIHNALRVGDKVEFVVPNGENIKMKIGRMFDAENGKEVNEAHGGQGRVIFLKTDKDIPVMSMARRRV